MLNTNTVFAAFAGVVEASCLELDLERGNLLKAFAAHHPSDIQASQRRLENIRGNLRRCLSDNAFGTLAAVSRVAAAGAEWAALLENRWRGDLTELARIGRLIADGEPDDLDHLVKLVCQDGWASLDGWEQDHIIGSRVRCQIAAAVDAYISKNPAWLHTADCDPWSSTAPRISPSMARIINASARQAYPAQPVQSANERAAVDMTSSSRGADVMATLESVLARPRPQRLHVFGEMAERRMVSLIAAAPGVGKTMLSIQVASAVASGKDWAGFAVPASGAVVYLNAEDSTDEVARRFEACSVARLLDQRAAASIFVVGREDHKPFMAKVAGEVSATDHGRWLLDAVAAIGPALIVIDPMAMTHGLDENSNADMAALTGYFGRLAAHGNAAVLVVHHAGKDDKAGLGAARGASAIAASARSMWHLHVPTGATQGDPTIQLTCVKSNHSPVGLPRSFRRSQVSIPNGDAVGLLVPVGTPPNRQSR